MAKAGLSFTSPMMDAMDVGPGVTPYSSVLNDPSRGVGLQGLAPTRADSLVGPEQMLSAATADLGSMRKPQAPRTFIGYDQARNIFNVNGFEFSADNASAALESEQYLSKPPTARPEGAWTELSPDMFGQYLQSIKQPSLGTTASKNFEIGMQSMKGLAGAGLMFAGAEELGAGMVKAATDRTNELAPYNISASDVMSGERGAVEYAVAMLSQQGPNILESIGAALVGAGAGAVSTGNPLGSALGGLGAMFSKGAIKTAAKEAAEAYIKKQATQEQIKLLAKIGGAGAATAVNNYAIGIADTYGEMRQDGEEGSRAAAAALGIPYAVLSTVPEAVAAMRVFGRFMPAAGAAAATRAPGVVGAAGQVGKSFAKGAGVGAALEGTTEAMQEGLVMAGGAGAGNVYGSDEVLARLVESGIAGAVVGGSIGGVANINTGKPANLLVSAPTEDTPQDGEVLPPMLPGPPERLALPAPTIEALALPAPTTPPVNEAGPFPATPDVIPMGQQALLRGAQPPSVIPMGDATAPTTQGLPLFDAAALPAGQGEMFPGAPTQVAPPPAPTPMSVSPQQMELPLNEPQQLPLPLPGGTTNLKRGEMARSGEATATMVPPVTGSAKLKRGKNVMQVEQAPALNKLMKPPAPEMTTTPEPVVTPEAAPTIPGVATPHDATIERFEDARMNDAPKLKLKSMVKKAVKDGVLTEEQAKSVDYLFNDKDMSADDIVPEVVSLVEENKNATQVGQVQQGDKLKRQRANAQVQGKGQDRLKQAQVSEGGAKTGGSNRLVESARAIREVESTSPKADGAAAAPSKKAESSTAVAVVEPKAVRDTEAENARIREAEKLAEDEAAKNVSDVQAVEDTIVLVNTTYDDDYVENLAILIEYANDKTDTGKDARARAKEYLDNEVEKDALYQRAVAMSKGKPAKSDPVAFDTSLIAQTISDINSGALRLTPMVRTKLIDAWRRLKKAGVDPQYGESVMSDFISGGQTFFNMRDGKVVSSKPVRYSLADWNTVDGAVDLDGKPLSRMAIGRVRLMAQSFVSKLAVKPKLHVFTTQADMKAKAPKLYAAIKKAYEGEDFDYKNAAGLAYGDDTVVIFSDRIASDQHLRFVLAHETIGHFGLRGIMPQPDFDKLMSDVYDGSPQVRNAVDPAMNVRGLSKSEAVEEYLADYAGHIETSTLMRVWNAIKSFLNKLGIKFGDEMVRYLLDQSKRYVRTGVKTNLLDMQTVGLRISAVEAGKTVRFSVTPSNDMRSIANTLTWDAWYRPESVKDAISLIKDKGLNTKEGWDTFLTQTLRLLNFNALRNPGMFKFEKLIDQSRQIQRRIETKFNDDLKSLFSKDGKYQRNVALALARGRSVSASRLRDNKVFDAASVVSVDSENGTVIWDTKLIDYLLKRGTLTFDELKNGVEYTVKEPTPAGVVTRTAKSEPIPELTKEQYEHYVQVRKAHADVELELLKAKVFSKLNVERVSKKAIRRMMKDEKLKRSDGSLIDKAVARYRKIYVANAKFDELGYQHLDSADIAKADDFLAAVNRALLSSDAKNDPEVRAFFEEQKEADDFMTKLDDMRSRRKQLGDSKDYRLFLAQNKIKEIILATDALDKDERQLKESIAGGYVNMQRNGKFEVRITAYDGDRAVAIDPDYRDRLIYSQFDTADTAKNAASLINDAMKGKKYTVRVYKGDEGWVPTEVTLRADYNTALTAAASDPKLDVEQFLYGMRLFGINPNPSTMEKIITTLTEAGDARRRKLEFADTPGFNPESALATMAQHISARASTIAKTEVRPELRQLLDRDEPESINMWTGDKQRVIQIKDAYDKASGPLKEHYKRELDTALYRFRQTNVGTDKWDGSKKDAPEVSGLGRGNKFYNDAVKIMNFMEGNQSTTDTDFALGPVAGTVRAATSLMMLGGSIAQGVLNMLSPFTNWIPYVGTRNEKTGFGGGFGMGASFTAYWSALTQVGNPGVVNFKYNSADFYLDLANGKNEALRQSIGLEKHEAMFLAQEIREGKMQPAQSNALLASARGRSTNRYFLAGMDAYMAPFNLTEQAVRRAAGLAAYRLEYARLKAVMDEADARSAARDFAVQSLDLTLGEYSAINRPAFWRDGIQSFLYMFKVYPTTVVQLYSNLDRKGKLFMLASLWVLAGMSGLPFAEDLEDLIDTLAQMLGFQVGSVRMEIAKALDSVFPGISPYALRGAVNTMLPMDFASRTGVGDLFPGTGILLAGSKPFEEAKELLGPAPSVMFGLPTMLRDLAMAPFSEKKSVEDALRAGPITSMRMLADTYAYMRSGAVIDRRGYVVTDDMTAGTVLTRLLGFYPVAAAEQYEVIKFANRTTNYQKDIVASFRLAWIKAKHRNDAMTMRSIEKSVDEWNTTARGTALEIRNFRKNSMRAYEESTRTATQRALKSAPVPARPDIERMMELTIN